MKNKKDYSISTVAPTITANVEAMASEGLRSDSLSTDTELDVRYNVGLTTKTFIGYSLC